MPPLRPAGAAAQAAAPSPPKAVSGTLTQADLAEPWFGPARNDAKIRQARIGARLAAHYVSDRSTPEAPLRTLDAIRDDFAFLDDWEDRYRYVIELGRELPDLPESARTDANKVRGCVSQVWIEDGVADGRIWLNGDSDSHLVRGLVAITIALYAGKTPAEALAVDAGAVYRELGLEAHLTPQRSNGVRSMIERIRNDAKALAS